MPRFERPITAEDRRLAAFARDLREVRHRAGTPSYRWLADRTGYSPSTLAKAASGKRLPTFPVLLAYVRACGGDAQRWRLRWRELDARMSTRAEETERPSRPAGTGADDRAEAASAIAAELRSMVEEVRRVATAARPATDPSRTEPRRNRTRVPGSSRHLAETIRTMRSSAGSVGHARVARALAGDPRHALDEHLVHAIVRACHELCGIPYTATDRRRWSERCNALASEGRSDWEGSVRTV